MEFSRAGPMWNYWRLDMYVWKKEYVQVFNSSMDTTIRYLLLNHRYENSDLATRTVWIFVKVTNILMIIQLVHSGYLLDTFWIPSGYLLDTF